MRGLALIDYLNKAIIVMAVKPPEPEMVKWHVGGKLSSIGVILFILLLSPALVHKACSLTGFQ